MGPTSQPEVQDIKLSWADKLHLLFQLQACNLLHHSRGESVKKESHPVSLTQTMKSLFIQKTRLMCQGNPIYPSQLQNWASDGDPGFWPAAASSGCRPPKRDDFSVCPKIIFSELQGFKTFLPEKCFIVNLADPFALCTSCTQCREVMTGFCHERGCVRNVW